MKTSTIIHFKILIWDETTGGMLECYQSVTSDDNYKKLVDHKLISYTNIQGINIYNVALGSKKTISISLYKYVQTS
jgi:hypothetical protein